jgi:glycosyltransferase involved in cell wall biosynthesis
VSSFYPDLERLAAALRRLRPRRASAPPEGWESPDVSAAPPRAGLQHWLSVPDWSVWWLPWVLARGLRLARGCDAVYVTAPPKGAVVAAAALARLARRPLLIDLRDPWFPDPSAVHATPLHRVADRGLERWCVATAASVILNTPRARDVYRRRFAEAPAGKFVAIPNGFDRDDYAPDSRLPGAPRDASRIAVSYFGSLYFGRDPRPLLRAARRVQESRGADRPRLAIRFWTMNRAVASEAARAEGAEAVTEVRAPIPHRDALREMARSDVLLLIGSPATDELHVAGKLFEYVYCRKPILALVEEGAISDLIDRYRLGLWCSPRDEERIVAHLEALAAQVESGAPWPIAPEALRDFDRREQAGRLAQLLDAALAR